jgi:hypothetical protein
MAVQHEQCGTYVIKGGKAVEWCQGGENCLIRLRQTGKRLDLLMPGVMLGGVCQEVIEGKAELKTGEDGRSYLA